MNVRLLSMDRIRSFALMLLVFLHSAVYHYARIFAVIDDPPLVIAVMGLLVLFGGAFIMMSGLVNTHVALERFVSGERRAGRICLDLVVTGTLMLVLHFVYNVCFGPASFDWEAETRAIALIPAWLGAEGAFDPRRLFEGSALSTIGANLILVGLILCFLLKKERIARRVHYWVLGVAALAFFSFAFFRYRYYPLAAQARGSGDWGLALLLGVLLEKPYPVLPYASFALFGAIIAFAIREPQARTILKWLSGLGFVLVVLGALFYIIIPPSLTAVTGAWFSRVIIEAGFFLLVAALSVLLGDRAPERGVLRQSRGLKLGGRTFRSFGAAALSIYFLETPLSGLSALLWDQFDPGWRNGIGSVMLFAAGNVLVWVVLLVLWRKADYRFSLDRLLARIQNRLGRRTARTDLSNYKEV
jgi:hypothetical protein